MYVLGIHGSFGRADHDAAAAVVHDTQTVAAVEEERFTRHKHAVGVMPENAIRYCLDAAGITMREVGAVAFPRATWRDFGQRLEAYLGYRFGSCPEIVFLDHHHCHAGVAFHTSGFSDGLIVTLDRSGDGVSCAVFRGDEDGLRLIDATPFPDSLGLFAALMTQYLGFRSNHDEYKVMGLAAYGEPVFDLSPILRLVEGRIRLDAQLLHAEVLREHPYFPTDQLPILRDEALPGLPPRRVPGAALRQEHRDLAASVQRTVEELMLRIVDHHRSADDRHLLVSGGVAENSVAMGRLVTEGNFKSVYAAPSSGDAGTALGAALLIGHETSGRPAALTSAQLGPRYTNDEVRHALDRCGVEYRVTADVPEVVSDLVCAGNTVAWFRGRLEFGPRALGGRSLLADASARETKRRVDTVKQRESFRPFGASVLVEQATTLFPKQVDALALEDHIVVK